MATTAQHILDFKLDGLTCAPVTPFTSSGSINFAVFDKYVQHLVDFGIKHVFVMGTNGESNSLSGLERKQLAEKWVSSCRGRLSSVMIQVGSGNLADSAELAKHAEQIGAHAIACVGPTYYKPETLDDYVGYMQAVAAAAPNLPFYLYDIDFITGIRFSSVDFFELALPRIPTLRGVKHTTPSFPNMHLLTAKFGSRVDVVLGCDETFLEGLAIGIDGCIILSFDGVLLNRVKEAFDRGDLAAARLNQIRVVHMWNIVRKYCTSVPAFTKTVLKLIDIDMGQPRPPLSPVKDEVVELLRNDLKKIGFFDWALP